MSQLWFLESYFCRLILGPVSVPSFTALYRDPGWTSCERLVEIQYLVPRSGLSVNQPGIVLVKVLACVLCRVLVSVLFRRALEVEL